MGTSLLSPAGNEFPRSPSWDIGFLRPSSGAKIAIDKVERPDQDNHKNCEHNLKPHCEKLGEQKHCSVKGQSLAKSEK